MPKNSCIMQIWAESGKSALPICNYSQILYQFLTFTQNLKRSRKGSVKRIAHKSFAISIVNNDGVRIDWLHISARSQNEAIRKARVTAARGCYKDQLDTITATESGIAYTYKTI